MGAELHRREAPQSWAREAGVGVGLSWIEAYGGIDNGSPSHRPGIVDTESFPLAPQEFIDLGGMDFLLGK